MEENDTFEDLSKVCNVSNQKTIDNNDPTLITSTISGQTPKELTIDSETEVFDRIASKLIRSGFLLTALELHAELIERGKESTRLRDFFDNPHNFEKHFESSPTKKPLTASATTTNQLIPATHSKNELRRSPSDKTFDSLDFTHYSDDDIERHGDERIAVLEFELRKAQQTINSLRASLTMSTTGQCVDNDQDVMDGGKNPISIKNNALNDSNQFFDPSYSMRDFYCRGSGDGDSCPGEDDKFSKSTTVPAAFANSTVVATTNLTTTLESNKFEPNSGYIQCSEKYSLATSIRPHEKRAINYLINEYLMENNYKLTSITFCDENTEQDFDNWEDVGLNLSRPPDLLKLYRNFWKNFGTTANNTLMRSNSNATTVVSNSQKTITLDE